MSKAVGILELSSIAKGMETGDAMLKSANVELLVSKTLCPGKFLLMLGGDVGAVQQAINSGRPLLVKCWSTVLSCRIFIPASFLQSADLTMLNSTGLSA